MNRMTKAELASIEDYLRLHIELARTDGLWVVGGLRLGYEHPRCCLLGAVARVLDDPEDSRHFVVVVAEALGITLSEASAIESGFELETVARPSPLHRLGARLRAECDAYLELPPKLRS